MKLGFSGQALGYAMAFADLCEMAKRYDMTVCQVWDCNAEGVGAGYIGRDIKKLKSVAADKGVTIECVTLGTAFDPNATADIKTYVKLLNNTIETAAELGAPRINHYCASICYDENADFGRMEKFWGEPLKLAAKYGIILALENEAHDATRTPDRMLKIVKHFGSKYFKTNLDVTNYYHAGCDGFPDAYETLKEHIGYVHLKSAVRNPNGFKYVPIPDGALNIAGLVSRIIEDNSYGGLCALEPHIDPEHVESYYSRESKFLYDTIKNWER